MSRNAAAMELQELIQQMNALAERGVKLATASGSLVNPMYFSAVRSSMMLAAGDLDRQGLLITHTGAMVATR